MAKPLSYKDGIGRKDLLAVRRRFVSIHRERLRRIAAELSTHQRAFIDLLPLLIHTNHPMLPGFVATEAPAGIPDYSPTQAVIRQARKLGRSFEYKKRARRSFAIQGLYLMGSIGSIGHSSGSDFDVWLCHDPELSPEGLSQLRLKTQKIEEWAEELSLEVHFFLMDVDEFRQGKHDTISHESSGSTQPHLLLEEFYRTGVLLAGRYPIWWLVPPEEEGRYDEFVEMLFHKRFVDPVDCLNFGNLQSLPPEEFLGAAHWQLFKGIESPYKTILKLFLTEAYSEDYPKVRWLCQEAKRSIYEGSFDMDSLDPYILMYRRVESYLSSRGETKRLEMARRCFYIKADQTLSKDHRRARNDWKRDLLSSLAKEWKWDQGELITLDSRLNWKIDQVMDERNTLVRELTHSYRLLTDFAREFASSNAIDPQEINLLGRKLYTAMEKRPGKIDRVNPGISRSLIESRVSIHHARTRGDSMAWFLFLGDIREKEARVTSPLKTCQSLIELLAWCHLNQVIDHNSNILLYPKNNPVRPEELYALISTLYNRYPIHETLEVPIDQLAAPPRALSCSLYLNTGHDPMAHLSKQGKQLTSDRSDPLSFGAAHTSLVRSMDQLITTSWGETLVTNREGTSGLLEGICYYLRMTLLVAPNIKAAPVSAHSFSSIRGGSTAKRVEQLFNDVLHFFGPNGMGLEGRYILQIGDEYSQIYRKNDRFIYFSIEGEEELHEVLSEPQVSFRPIYIDRATLKQSPLPTIFNMNKEGVIQVFYHSHGGMTALYILDEHGSLFQQQLSGMDDHFLLVQQQRFLSGLRLLRSFLVTNEPAERLLLDAPEFHQLIQDRTTQFSAEPRTPPRHRLPDNYLDLQVTCDRLDVRQASILITCGDQDFDSFEYGEQLYTEVTRHILSSRRGRQDYPIYLTGLQLSGTIAEDNTSTIELLHFKKRVEMKLNEALKDLLR